MAQLPAGDVLRQAVAVEGSACVGGVASLRLPLLLRMIVRRRPPHPAYWPLVERRRRAAAVARLSGWWSEVGAAATAGRPWLVGLLLGCQLLVHGLLH